ncbi:hypothetical protein N431DRAFT_410930 [Stipitochalara longipes BDJ]|nr:hypothetical protein N431DRAFT_410930 [Stipitochalara longipes BDJ]
MALASPVWNKFVFPPFRTSTKNTSASKETKTTGKLKDSGVPNGLGSADTTKSDGSKSSAKPVDELDFTEDLVNALLILLNITHLRFASIPSTVTTAILSEIAILCDKYDCVLLVKPWLTQWLAQENSVWKSPTAQIIPGRERWLFIAWAFGREQIMKELALLLVRELTVFGKGNGLALAGRWGPMPLGLIESILRVCRSTIEKLLGIPDKCVKVFTLNSGVLCLRKEPVCDSTIYGSLLRGLQLHQIDPNVDPDNLHISVNELGVKLNAIQIHVHPNASSYSSLSHTNCFTTNIKQEVDCIMASIEDSVLEPLVCRMAAQQARLNLGVS